MEGPIHTNYEHEVVAKHDQLPDTQPCQPDCSTSTSTPPNDDDSETVSQTSSQTSFDQHSLGSTTDDASSKPPTASIIATPLAPPSTVPTEVLELDKRTPDHHVRRDPRLIRLTGVHPFNVEPPLSALFDQGFLTSPELFYVRNHGAVPLVEEADALDWEFEVAGEVDNPFKLSLRDLLADYEQLTCPITLVCAGNRRKEQNVVRKSKGFSWGPAGLATALFTGCMMADVIRSARPRRGARFVCMEGADKLPNGYYGTSVKLNWVLDNNRGIMLAHGMNGEVLLPDHGYPLRAVIPGQIGGRSVKWLKKLIVTAAPSDNWYHIYDNRVLPTMISPEESANEPAWWKDDRYAIYELSVNSAMAYPAHEERICLVEAAETYRCRGYAYAGGGRRIGRVEISLDQGRTWRLAEIEYPEDRYRETELPELYGGKLDMWTREASHCWCFWSYDVPVADLRDSSDILVRAMDEAMNVQPRDMYWSVLGMMNNPWFRVTIARDGDFLRFEHPTQPALMPGGWMERVKKAGGNLTNGHWGERIGGADEDERVGVRDEVMAAKEVPMTRDGVCREIEVDELRKHDAETEPWFVLNGHVYNGTAFLDEHPGGAQSIVSAAGIDSTDEFMAIHSETAKAMMPKYHIGTLSAAAKTALVDGETSTLLVKPTAKRTTFLQAKVWTQALLSSKKVVSWDTRIFTFSLEHPEQTLGLPIGQHLMIRLRDPVTRESIIRSYTPISEQSEPGRVDVLVKVYFDKPGAKGGKMSQAMDALPVGHGIDFKGPIGKFEYLGDGRCHVSGRGDIAVKRFLMICGGSGVTPVYQVFRAVMRDPRDPTECVMLDGNRLVEDILCKDELDALELGGGGRGKVVHTLTQAPEAWLGLRGRVDAELVRRHCPRLVHGKYDGAGGETMVLICGPEALEKSMHKALLEDGWADQDLLFF